MRYLAKPMYAMMILAAGVAGYYLYRAAMDLAKALIG